MKSLKPFLLLVAFSAVASEPVRVEITRDNWISSSATEVEGNNGASPKLKLKGVQELALMDVDAGALKGRRVVKAELHLHGLGDEVLRRITVSTITDEWAEGDATGYKKTPGASSFAWARTGERRWGGTEPDITGVMCGAGGSVWSFGDASPRNADGWQVIPVAPAVVQARIDGRGFGFAVMDDVGSEYTRDGSRFTYRPFLNRYVSSKDDKRSARPFFLLWLEDGAPAAATPAPAKAAIIEVAKLPAATLPQAQNLGVKALDEYGEPLRSLDFAAAKGETISFSVDAAATIELPGVKATSFAMPLIEGRADPLMPGPSEGATCFDLHVPKDSRAGRISGTLRVGGKVLPCSLTVWDFTLPDRLSFIAQMNCYGLPGHERDYYRLAHAHRTTLNCLPYHWNGRIDAGPVIKADGAWDWSAWDAQYGPLLDGSAFADLPRGPVPTEAFYLMLNEAWPMQHDAHFKGGYSIESAYDDAYWKEFRAAAAKIAQHVASKGWSEPMFEFYLNNKVSNKKAGWEKSTAPWILDEPSNTQDFWALRRFGIEFWSGVAAHPGARLVYRADISRPQWQRDLFDGVVNVEVVSGSLRTYGHRVRERAQRFGSLFYMYGSANAIGTPNVANAAWCVEAWALGADGVVPWQTVGKAAAWQKADELSLFYPTDRGPVPSLRLKAFRAGQQLVEYLTMYAALSGQSRESIGRALLESGLRATTVKKNEDDAGESAFPPDAGSRLGTLRQSLGTWLSQKSPPSRERWHDPRPRAQDAAKVKLIAPVQP